MMLFQDPVDTAGNPWYEFKGGHRANWFIDKTLIDSDLELKRPVRDASSGLFVT
jgi:hypothetical protein